MCPKSLIIQFQDEPPGTTVSTCQKHPKFKVVDVLFTIMLQILLVIKWKKYQSVHLDYIPTWPVQAVADTY